SCLLASSLLAHGAEVDAVNTEKKTALFHAAALSRHRMVVLLLNSGANPKARDCFDNTPLHFAFLPQTAMALLEAGADPNAQNHTGYRPLHVMQAFGNEDVVGVLRAYQANEMLKTKSGATECKASKGNCIVLPFFGPDFSAAATGGLVLESADAASDMRHQAK